VPVEDATASLRRRSARDHRAIRRPALAASLIAVSASVAHADPRWYGRPTVLLDLSSDVVIVGGAALESGPLVGLGVAGYVLGGPTVHIAEGAWDRAWGSFGLRLGLPLLGGLAGHTACLDDSGFLRCVGSALGGALLGVVAAQVLDPLLLTYAEERPDPAPMGLRLGGVF
jgi:hypothetical protein